MKKIESSDRKDWSGALHRLCCLTKIRSYSLKNYQTKKDYLWQSKLLPSSHVVDMVNSEVIN